jgi:hypothetical protein
MHSGNQQLLQSFNHEQSPQEQNNSQVWNFCQDHWSHGGIMHSGNQQLLQSFNHKQSPQEQNNSQVWTWLNIAEMIGGMIFPLDICATNSRIKTVQYDKEANSI